MSKFKNGETSSAVIEIKDSITKCINKKSNLIDHIFSYNDIPVSLTMKSKHISLMSVHAWHDEELGITGYSYNTSKATHNKKALQILKDSIRGANDRLKESSTSPTKDSGNSNEFDKLKNENEQLRTALGEVYRAYMQLLDEYREDAEIDIAFRKMILNQAKVLGKNRIWEVN